MSDQTAETKPEDVLKAQIAAQDAQIATQNAQIAAQRAELAGVSGKIDLLVSAATAGQGQPPLQETPPDIVNEPEKALDYFWQKKAAPVIAANTEQAAATQKDLVSLRRKEDWDEFGPKVEQLIRERGIQKATLASPGSYEQLLDLVKAQHVEQIVKKKVEAEVAAFQAKAAMASGGGQTGPTGSPAPKKEGEANYDDRQLSILAKLGVDPKRAAEAQKNVEDRGFLLVGEVA